MTQANNNFEGGSDTVTISTGNSGGTSGTAFDNVSGTPTFSVGQTRGTMAGKIATSASATQYVAWTTSVGTVTEAYGRAYCYFDIGSATNISLARFLEFRDGTGLACFIRPASTGRVTEIANAAGSIIATGSTAWAKNGWIRVEWHIIFSTTVGFIEVKLFNSADSTTPDETITTSSSEVLRASGTILRMGCTTSIANWPVSGGAQYFDDLVWGAASYPGPSGGTNVTINAPAALGTGLASPTSASVEGGPLASVAAGIAPAAVPTLTMGGQALAAGVAPAPTITKTGGDKTITAVPALAVGRSDTQALTVGVSPSAAVAQGIAGTGYGSEWGGGWGSGQAVHATLTLTGQALAAGRGITPDPQLAVTALATANAPGIPALPQITVTALALAAGVGEVPTISTGGPPITINAVAAIGTGLAPTPIPTVTVTALALALGVGPVPTITAGANRTFFPPAALSAGAPPVPTPQLSVTVAVALSAGISPLAAPTLSFTALALAAGRGNAPLPTITVTAVALATGPAPAPTVTAGNDRTINAALARSAGLGPLPVPTLLVTAVALSAGRGLVPTVSIGRTVTVVVALAVGQGQPPVPTFTFTAGALAVGRASATPGITVTAVAVANAYAPSAFPPFGAHPTVTDVTHAVILEAITGVTVTAGRSRTRVGHGRAGVQTGNGRTRSLVLTGGDTDA